MKEKVQEKAQVKAQKYLLFLGGEFNPAHLLPMNTAELGGIICADKGASYALQAGLLPTLVVGDCDSLSAAELARLCQYKQICFRQYPKEKDFTDGELAFLAATELGAKDVVVYGAFGGRLDHQMANIFLAATVNHHFDSLVLAGDGFSARVLEGKTAFAVEGEAGDLVSLVCLGPAVKGLTLRGFRYPLTNREVLFGSTLTISNELCTSKAIVSLEQGQLLYIHYRLGKRTYG